VAAASLLLCLSGARRVLPVARALAAAVAALGAATLAEHLTGVDLGIDTLLAPEIAQAPATTSPGRMGPPAATNLFALGIALLLLTRPRGARAAQAVALGVAAVPLLAAVGYAYDVAILYEQPRLTAVALPTAAGLLLLDLGVLLARPGDGFIATLATIGAASAVARRVLASIVVLPLAVGFGALVWTGGVQGGDAALAVSFVVTGLTIGLVVLVLAGAAAIEKVEGAGLRAHAEREASREELAAALRREREARAASENASRAKDLFLGTLSHELRTPLNAIVGWSRLLRDAPGDAVRLARGLSAIERNGHALAQHVADLLDMSHLASGKVHLDPAEVDFGAVVERAVEAVRPSAETKGATVVLARPADSLRVLGDAGRLQQVAWNLLSNAVKFSSAGGRVDVRIARDDLGRAVLEVSDSGAGIAPEVLPHVFGSFVQADGSAARRHGGLGLGLAVTRALVRLHKGEIEAASAGPGRGARFSVRLPALSAAPARPQPPRSTLAGARILVVEDEEDSRELLLQLLQSWGARASGAASARDALAVSARERPDVVLSDIAMPGEDGYALVAELRRRERVDGGAHLPAAALTAFTRPEDRRRVLAAGFDAHVAKPIDPAALRDALEALLGRVVRPPGPTVLSTV
jgi:signal transduction histidine kinase/ActR/RegA family two-component response regulator